MLTEYVQKHRFVKALAFATSLRSPSKINRESEIGRMRMTGKCWTPHSQLWVISSSLILMEVSYAAVVHGVLRSLGSSINSGCASRPFPEALACFSMLTKAHK